MTVDPIEFDVALSFAGEDRKYVDKVASFLKKMGIKVFYDKYEEATLWGKDLYEHLIDIYKNKSRYTVIFASKHYSEKLWTTHERRAAQSRAFESHREYILPVRIDDTEIPGILLSIGYKRSNNFSPRKLAELIKAKVGPIYRENFFPDDPDLLYKPLKANTLKKQDEIREIAQHFFETFCYMTTEERFLLIDAIKNLCPCGFPHEIHLRLDLLSRIQNKSKDEIILIFSKLSCLGLSVTVTQEKESDKNKICKSFDRITIKYIPLIIDCRENCTEIVIEIINIIYTRACDKCAKNAIEHCDFSLLSSFAGYPDNE